MSKTTDYLVRKLTDAEDTISALLIQHREREAMAWDRGFTAHFEEERRQGEDPTYAIRRDNPFVTTSVPLGTD